MSQVVLGSRVHKSISFVLLATFTAYLKDLKELHKLILLGASVSDESVSVFAGMTHLRELDLYRSRVTNSGLAMLAKLHDLASIDLRYSRVSSTGVDALRTALPGCEIEFVGQ